MAASREEVFERVKEVLTEQLGIDEGEITEDELGALASRIRPTRRALRYFDQVEWDSE